MVSASDRSLSDIRILVADDSTYAADTLAELLRLEFACNVFVAYDGEQALHTAMAERPDVSILDIRMPRLNGIEVARRIRAASAEPGVAPPRLIAMTGDMGVNERWTEIDDSFDAAYAKPVDIERLLADVARHWQGRPARPVRVRFDIHECFTRAVRDVLPLMAQRHQTVSFDCSDESVVVEADDVALRSALYRLMAGLADVITQGFVVLHADLRVDADGAALLSMTAGGTGGVAPPERIAHVLERLALTPDASARPGGALVASGVCPSSGGHVSFTSEPGEGALFRLEWNGGPVVERADAAARASGASAWLIDTDGPAAPMLERRLQRFGWRVRRQGSMAAATAAAAAFDRTGDEAPPSLVVVHESDPLTSARAVVALAARLPAQTSVLLLVRAGSPTLTGPDPAPVTVRVKPLSPGDLGRLTEHALRTDADARDGPVSAWANVAQPRSRVLVVDDNEVNRMVASGLVRALGYDVVCASDGLDAIEQCKASPPDVVLMDVNMPVLDGIDATLRLRELQRSGRVAPFAIVAATAAIDETTEQRCLDAGMDGFLSKPLRLPVMRSELRRVTHQDR